MTIVFASWNTQKCEELKRMAVHGIKMICLGDIPEAKGIPQADENGTTFIENALIKAKYWAKKLNMPVLAEDSGIRIAALGGYPGVETKRCIEKFCPNADINVDNPSELYPILLDFMENSGNSTKKAQWISAMALVSGEKAYTSQDSLCGEMCQCAGERVFGFDQYFKPVNMNKTLSEMSSEEKDEIGPRKKVFIEVLNHFKNF